MISRQDIEKLAKLSRIELNEEELSQYEKEIDAILGYVDVLKKASADAPKNLAYPHSVNVFREDINPRETGEYTERLLNAAPSTDDGYVQVKHLFS